MLEDNLWDICTINTIGLDRNNKMSTFLQEVLGIYPNNSCLIRLSNIGKDNIYHTNLDNN
jgi:hypothetical protein